MSSVLVQAPLALQFIGKVVFGSYCLVVYVCNHVGGSSVLYSLWSLSSFLTFRLQERNSNCLLRSREILQKLQRPVCFIQPV